MNFIVFHNIVGRIQIFPYICLKSRYVTEHPSNHFQHILVAWATCGYKRSYNEHGEDDEEEDNNEGDDYLSWPEHRRRPGEQEESANGPTMKILPSILPCSREMKQQLLLVRHLGSKTDAHTSCLSRIYWHKNNWVQCPELL